MAKSEFKRKTSLSKDRANNDIVNAFHVLSLSVIDLSQSLKKARRQFHSKELSDPKWHVMTMLEHMGPQTVPQMARSRKLSRQGIQNTVNILRKEGFVEFNENPAHKKSQMVCLTPEGSALADEMTRREREIISKVNIGAKTEEMLTAAKVIQILKSFFEGKQWKEVLEKSRSK